MKVLVKEKLSPHKYKTPEGYLVCEDAILARTGSQEYRRSELFDTDSDEIVNVVRDSEEVFSPITMSSFENKPITSEHPDEDVCPLNYNDYAVGFVRDIRRSTVGDEEVMIGNLIITDADAINDIENGIRTELSCGYNCDITDTNPPRQVNIRGNHVALCKNGRAGIAKIVDSKPEGKYVVYADGTWDKKRALFAKKNGAPRYSYEADADVFTKEEAEKRTKSNGKYIWVMERVGDSDAKSAVKDLEDLVYNAKSEMENAEDKETYFNDLYKKATDLLSKMNKEDKESGVEMINGTFKRILHDFDLDITKLFHVKLDDKLIQSASKEAFKKNVATEIEAGKDPKQAVAIAYSVQRANDGFRGEVVDKNGNIVYRGKTIYVADENFDEANAFLVVLDNEDYYGDTLEEMIDIVDDFCDKSSKMLRDKLISMKKINDDIDNALAEDLRKSIIKNKNEVREMEEPEDEKYRLRFHKAKYNLLKELEQQEKKQRNG